MARKELPFFLSDDHIMRPSFRSRNWLSFVSVLVLVFLGAQQYALASSSDLYELLGVEENASDADIKRAHRQLSLQFHPDKRDE